MLTCAIGRGRYSCQRLLKCLDPVWWRCQFSDEAWDEVDKSKMDLGTFILKIYHIKYQSTMDNCTLFRYRGLSLLILIIYLYHLLFSYYCKANEVITRKIASWLAGKPQLFEDVYFRLKMVMFQLAMLVFRGFWLMSIYLDPDPHAYLRSQENTMYRISFGDRCSRPFAFFLLRKVGVFYVSKQKNKTNALSPQAAIQSAKAAQLPSLKLT